MGKQKKKKVIFVPNLKAFCNASKEFIVSLLDKFGGNKTKVSQELLVTNEALEERMKDLDLE